MLNIRCVFKNHCQAEIKGCKKKGWAARKVFSGKKQEQQRRAATWRAAGVRPSEAKKAGDHRRQRKWQRRKENWGRGGEPKRTRNISSHTVTEIAANTDRGTERTPVSDTQRCESTDCPEGHCGRRERERKARPCCLFWSCEEEGASAPRCPALTGQILS